MILVRAPLRVSFFGGGTDAAPHYTRFGGAVLSTAIDKYMYIAVNKTPINHVKLMYSEIELVDDYQKIKHDIVRNAIRYHGKKHQSGLEISSFADIPTVGTGLGSSSTFSVAMIHALSVMNGFHLSKNSIADAACDLEINKCASPIGKQDQYASAFGGMNYIRFNKDHSVNVEPVYAEPIQDGTGLWQNLLLFYTGRTRFANNILAKQNGEPKHDVMCELKAQADQGLKHVINAEYDDFGYLLNDAWRLKVKMADGISDPEIDAHYTAAIDAGAYGGKILGAGGGGYFLFYAPLINQTNVIETLQSRGLQHVSFNFSKTGVETLYSDIRY